jgi:sterol desaturase/sphingolipid hydroxylase (fatty acid hydroxylase superfamily)
VDVSYIILAVPVFFALIGIELLAARLQRSDYYRFSDSMSDLSCGMVQQVIGVFLKTVIFGAYVFVYGRLRMATLPERSVLVWCACFLGIDFLYYWFHRTSHRVNAVWATHVVHHQSEDFNLAVALRQAAFQEAFSWLYYLPLAVLGFPPLVFLAAVTANTLYQFWIHTRAIGKLGPLEWVLNTPSHHRVHHGRNPKYIDRNYAGALIVWDRMFGTFQEEEDEPVYGITTPLASWSPVWANVHYWVELFGLARATRGAGDRFRLFLAPPGWRPAELGGFQPAPEVDPAYRKFDIAVPPGLKAYVFVQFLGALAFGGVFVFREKDWPLIGRVAAAAAIVVTLAVLSALLERRRWAALVEGVRLLAAGVVAAGAAVAEGVPALAAAALLAGAGFGLWLFRVASTGLTLEDAAPSLPGPSAGGSP